MATEPEASAEGTQKGARDRRGRYLPGTRPTNGRTWIPGQSGNPAGGSLSAKPYTAALKRIEEKGPRGLSPDAIAAKLVRIAAGELEATPIQLQAINMLLNRREGLPRVEAELDVLVSQRIGLTPARDGEIVEAELATGDEAHAAIEPSTSGVALSLPPAQNGHNGHSP